MFEQVLSQCRDNYKSAECCHGNDNPCNCYNCLNTGFFSHSDEYDCEKKMLFYVLNYGASYVSEFYYYLSVSEILNDFSGNLNVLSLGCGFCPDYYALSKFIADNNLNIQLSHLGIDNSIFWEKTRLNYPNIKYQQADLTDLSTPLSFQGYNLITINKVFSSLYERNSNHISFLQNIGNAVKTSMQDNSILIFNDVNSIHMGRDIFDNTIRRYFNNIRRFYTGYPPYVGDNWIPIPQTNVIYPINNFENITPLTTVTKTVFFEYRK